MSNTLTKILYVEDEPDIQAVAKMALEAVGGYTVKVCSSGKEALEAAPDFGAQLILLDVMMPEMDGIETFKRLRELECTAEVPVIFMTAKVQKHEIAEYRDLGALDVIVKPFDPMTLSGKVLECWESAGAG